MKGSVPSLKLAGLLVVSMMVFAFLGAGQVIAQGPFSWQLDQVVSTSSDSGTTPQITVTMLADDDTNEDDLRSLTLGFPDGLVPVATGFEYCKMVQDQDETFRCSNPNAQAVGSLKIRLAIELLTDYSEVEADLYLDEPSSGEAARMVAPLPGLPLDLPESTVKLKENGWGIRNIVSDLPNQVTVGGAPLDIHISKIELTLDGSVKNASGAPFLTVPAMCQPVSFEATFTSYAGEVRSDTEPFPVSNCQVISYAPKLDLSLSSSLAGAPSSLATTTQANAGDAPTRELKINVPSGFRLAPSTVTPCTLSEVATKACPAHAAIGSLSVANPISSEELQGTVYITEPSGDAIGTWVLISASFGQIELDGTIRQTSDGGLALALSGLPPFGGGSVALSLSPSNGGSFTNPFSCGTYGATSTLTSHSDKQATVNHPLTVSGCGSLSAFGNSFEVKIWKPYANRHTDIRLDAIQGTPRKLTKTFFYLPGDLRISVSRPTKKRPLAYLEAWGTTNVTRGRLYIAKRTKRSLRLRAKSSQLKELSVTIAKPKVGHNDRGESKKKLRKQRSGPKERRTKVTVEGLPKTPEIEKISLRLFGMRTRLIRTFRRCSRARQLSFSAKLYPESDEPKEMSTSATVECLASKTGQSERR